MNIFVLLYNSGTDKEGIHSIELKGRTIVLMFEDKDDATRYCGLLEAQDFRLFRLYHRAQPVGPYG